MKKNMGAKRKRAARKPVSKKPSTVGQNEEKNKKSAPLLSSPVGQKEDACLNFVNQNNKENSRCEDSNDYEVGQPNQGSGNDIHFAVGGSSSSSSESDESFNVEDSSSDDSSIDKRSSKLFKGHGKATQKSRELSKKEGKENYNSSRVLRSSGRNPKELMTPPQVLQCTDKDLRSALAVIKKVMQMDEAQPFNVPVDPDALGKPDYLDVIDNPMDFGTICRMLQNNVRYINSEDVFKDVKLIWENCCKYHKKGEYVVYLVKRVKKKFMKYWMAAGLGIEQSRKPNGNSHLQAPLDYAMRHSRCDPVHALGNAMDGTRQIQQNRLDTYQLHMQVPPYGYNQFYQPQQPLPSAMSPPFSQFHPSSYVHPYQLQHPQPSSNQPQYSQLPHRADCSSAGHSHFQPPTDSVQNYKNYPPRSSLGPTASGPANQPQPLQPQLGHAQPCVSQQPQQSTSKLRQSRLQSAPDTGYSHMPPQTDGTRYSGCVPPTDSVVVGPGQQHPQQSPLSNGQFNEPQQRLVSHGQPQSSWLPANGDTENSQVSLTDSAMRGIRCALRYSAGPTTDNPSQGDEDQLGPAESHPEHTQLNQNQETQSQQQCTKKMKRVRGPTRCLFLRDLPEGQRIIVHIDNQGRPVGSEAAKLSSFLGTIARDGHTAPLTFFNWKEMPDSYKEDMWHLVQEKFDVDPSCKAWVLRSLAIKWNNWKTDIKAKHYYPHKTDKERLKDCPPRIVPDQWPILISYWNSDSVKMVCAINKANRAKQKGGHTTGQKSYARVLEEERRKRPDGKEPTRAELYILTHTRKDGQPIDEIAATTISKLLEAKKQKTSECSDDSNDTFCQAIDEENLSPIHSNGLGPTNDDFHGQKPNGGNLTRMTSHARKSAKKEVSKVLEKIDAVEQKYDRIENQIAALTSNMQKFLDKLGGLPNNSGTEQAANP